MKIKICGITCPEDAEVAVAAGADFVGLNFFAGSRRCINVETACAIRSILPPAVAAIGVFVNASVDEIVHVCESAKLNGVQLHGDEPPETIVELRGRDVRMVIRAHRCRGQDLSELSQYLEQCHRLECVPDLLLLDADVRGSFGGTGQPGPWSLIASRYDYSHWPPLLLAGGLTPENVTEAIRQVRPWGVDVASGVERHAEPGPPRKDAAKVAAFLRAAREAPKATGRR